MRRFLAFLLSISLVAPIFTPYATLAASTTTPAGFDPNHVLEDDDIFNVNGMTYDRMVAFLHSKGTLSEVTQPDTDGVQKSVADIIWRVANSYKMNPKYLLALIQKEQSLVEDPHPTQRQFDWAAGYGVCDDCSKNDPSIQEFKGFASQIEWAAKQHREKYLLQLLGSGKTIAGKSIGLSMNVDGQTVTPVNMATAMLYSYTPHIHGNLNLWNIWRRWFNLSYPDGTIVQSKGTGKAYVIRNGTKRPFASRAVMMTRVNMEKVVAVSEMELTSYPDGDSIKFPKFALLRDPKKHIYLLTDEGKRPIKDLATFRKFGFNEDEIEDVEFADIADIPTASIISSTTVFPIGALLQDSKTKEIWYIEDGIRHLIPANVYLTLYFSGRQVRQNLTKKIQAYKLGDPYKLQDGELVRGKTNTSVYAVDSGLLRPIPSEDVFNAIGWNWKNVVTIPDAVLATYQTGDPIGSSSSIDLPTTSSSTILTKL